MFFFTAMVLLQLDSFSYFHHLSIAILDVVLSYRN